MPPQRLLTPFCFSCHAVDLSSIFNLQEYGAFAVMLPYSLIRLLINWLACARNASFPRFNPAPSTQIPLHASKPTLTVLVLTLPPIR